MELIDTHSHIYMSEFSADADSFIQRAKNVGVTHICLPNVDSETAVDLSAMAQRYPGYCLPMMGLHPTCVKEDFKQQLDFVSDQLAHNQYIAVGEIGMDLYWDKTFAAEQKHAFLIQLELAEQYRLPVNVHIRDAFNETFAALEEFGKNRVEGVFHCFSGTVDQARKAIDLGFLLGIGGVVTFKKATLAEVVMEIGAEHLVLETDAPYLAPVPFRGKLNESAYLPHIAQRVADLLGMNVEDVAKITSANARKLYRIA